jgi:hypothetical protein
MECTLILTGKAPRRRMATSSGPGFRPSSTAAGYQGFEVGRDDGKAPNFQITAQGADFGATIEVATADKEYICRSSPILGSVGKEDYPK